MKSAGTRNKRFAYLFLLGVLAFNFPLISLFDSRIMIMGIPLLYLYLFFTWFLLIVFVGLTGRSRSKGS